VIAQRYGFLVAAIFSGVGGLAWLLAEPDGRLMQKRKSSQQY
jgi:hypothetical protein